MEQGARRKTNNRQSDVNNLPFNDLRVNIIRIYMGLVWALSLSDLNMGAPEDWILWNWAVKEYSRTTENCCLRMFNIDRWLCQHPKDFRQNCILTVFRSFMIMCGMIGLFYLVSINQLIMPQKLRNQSLMFLTFGVLCLALRSEFDLTLEKIGRQACCCRKVVTNIRQQHQPQT